MLCCVFVFELPCQGFVALVALWKSQKLKEPRHIDLAVKTYSNLLVAYTVAVVSSLHRKLC